MDDQSASYIDRPQFDQNAYDNLSRIEAEGRIPAGSAEQWKAQAIADYQAEEQGRKIRSDERTKAEAEERMVRANTPEGKQAVQVDYGNGPQWHYEGMPSKDSFVDKVAGAIPYIGGALITAGGAGLLGAGAGAAEGAGAIGATEGAGSWITDASLAGGGEVGSGYASSAPGVLAGTAATGALGADAALAGGGEVGSGYAASAPGATTVPAVPNPSVDSPFPPSEISAPPVPSGTPTASGMPVGSGGADIPGPSSELISEPPGTPPSTPQAAPKPPLSDRALAAITNNPLMAGALGLNLAGQIQSSNAQKKREETMREATAPANAAAKQLIEQGLAGQVPPAIMAQFDRSLNERVNEIKQRYANMGRDAKTDSAAQNEISKAVATKDAQVAKYAQDLISQGLSAAGVSAGPQAAAIQAGAAQDHALQQAMGGTLNSMAMLEQLKRNQNPSTTTP